MSPFRPGKPTLTVPKPKPQSDQLPVDNSHPSGDSSLGDPAPNPLAPLKLTQDQLTAAGLDNLKAGQKFTITITGTANKVGDNGLEADIEDAVNGEVNDEEDGGSEENDNPGDEDYGKPSGKIEMGPGKDMM